MPDDPAAVRVGDTHRLFEGCGRSWELGARSGVIACRPVSFSGRLAPKEVSWAWMRTTPP
jgi:hypothetical protein